MVVVIVVVVIAVLCVVTVAVGRGNRGARCPGTYSRRKYDTGIMALLAAGMSEDNGRSHDPHNVQPSW